MGRSLSEECGLGDCVLGEEEKKVEEDEDERMMMDGDSKIIHFQRHGQGKTWIFLLQQIMLYRNIYPSFITSLYQFFQNPPKDITI